MCEVWRRVFRALVFSKCLTEHVGSNAENDGGEDEMGDDGYSRR